MAKTKAKFAVELTQEALKSRDPRAAFMVDGKAIELDAENPRFETDDEALYRSLREMPGLKALGDVSSESKGGEG